MSVMNQVQVKLTGVHLCCQGCAHAADAALMSVEGVCSHCNLEDGTVTFTAHDEAAAQSALDALAAAGFHGSTGNSHLAMRGVSSIPRGKVKSLKVSGIHNCCGPCCDAIKGALATVEGVTGDTAQPRATSFDVSGYFSAVALVGALNAAGFSARVCQ